MQLVQWIHKIAKANSIMYPGYKDKLYLTKLFLNTLILGNETMEYGKLFHFTPPESATDCGGVPIKTSMDNNAQIQFRAYSYRKCS